MTTIGGSYQTLIDYAKVEAPGGGIDTVIDVLSTSNPIIEDANVMEGNLPTGHRFTVSSSEPTGSWRLLNKGVSPEKGTHEQVTETCGLLETYSQVDVALANLGGNAVAYRATQDKRFIAGLSKTAATSIFYANQNVDPEKMHGLAPRKNKIGDTVLNAGGSSTDNTSIWFITWGPLTCSLIYPKGSKAGLSIEDLGQNTSVDSNGLMYEVYRTHFVWNLGMAVFDPRYVIRIANIDVSDLTGDAGSGADLMNLMIEAYYARPTDALGNMAKTFIYCNKTVAKYLHKQAQNKSNVNLTIDMPAGKPIVSFLDAPIHVCDALINIESAVSA
jgi:hypothetical protein